jgi:CRISPR/Cas system-associated exonuclease Cas4 (RecB family)
MGLSKSRFIAGWQCLKRLYLEVHQPELAGELDEQSIAVFEQGHEVGRWAQNMFPGGVLIEAGHEDVGKALQQTEQALTGKEHPAVFEGAFTHDGILARVDILERRPRNKWRLIEVKSSTKLKDYYLYDVAIQRLILEGLGMKVVPCLMHLNREYVYDGKQYELEKLFVIRDIADETAALGQDVKDLIREERRVLGKATPPDIKPGSHCTNPFGCEFYEVCNKPLPADHISYLPGISAKKLEELSSRGIESIGKIPSNFPLAERQKRAWECARTGKPWFGKGLREALAGLHYPLYFMDFETLGVALPRYAGMSPYDQIPFQWSVHVQRKAGADLEHYEFLADDTIDPRREFARSLLQVIGKKGSILAYSSGFESGCLASLAEWLPQYKDEIENIQDRLWDPLPVIRAHVYDLAFRGSYSLKSVLPALVPGMSYDGMEVAEGNEAGLAWEKMIHAEAGSEERKKLRDALVAYCKQDTLAMLRLLEVLYGHTRDR